MGFFSKECAECTESIRSPYSITEDTAWMSQAVAVSESGTISSGEYDGYGNIGSAEGGTSLHDATVWHRKCWEDHGRPTEFNGDSPWAADQGYFIDEGRDEECRYCSNPAEYDGVCEDCHEEDEWGE